MHDNDKPTSSIAQDEWAVMAEMVRAAIRDASIQRQIVDLHGLSIWLGVVRQAYSLDVLLSSYDNSVEFARKFDPNTLDDE